MEKVNILLSRCVEHCKCRYDGSVINDSFVRELKEHVNFITVCPEVEIGLGIPRKSLRIVYKDGKEMFLNSMNGEDHTDKIIKFSKDFVKNLNFEEIDGFILKSRSPSCGIKDVKKYKDFGKSPKYNDKTNGFFAREIIDFSDGKIIEDEGRLNNYNLREHFLIRVYLNKRFRELKKINKIGAVVDFHSKEKYLYMCYNQTKSNELGRLLANNVNKDIKEILKEYEIIMNKILEKMPRASNNINMLLHCLGYFSKKINSKEKAFFLDHIEEYRNKRIPFSNLLSLIESWAVRFDEKYLLEQTIFHSFPKELITVNDSGKGRV